MIDVNLLPIEDERAYNICLRHINENILNGLYYYVDVYKNESSSEWVWIAEEFAPKGYTGDLCEEMKKIIKLVKSENLCTLNAVQKYILMSTLQDYYEENIQDYSIDCALRADEDGFIALNIFTIPNKEDREYVLKMIRKECSENKYNRDYDENYTIEDDVENIMQMVEDLRYYEEACFRDADYTFLGEYTKEELLSIPGIEMLGLDLN